MSIRAGQGKQIYSAASSIPFFQEVMQTSDSPATVNRTPSVMIKGDIRLRVSEAHAALKPIKGSYRIDMEDMQEPLQVIWIAEGRVLRHSVHDIDMEFDLRGARAGETRTHLLTAHVTELGGQGSIVQSSVFVQIFVI
jgi:uncharacterized protein (DUF2252 family)